MISDKHISKIIIVITAAAVVFCLLAVLFADKLISSEDDRKVALAYEQELFDTDNILEVNIIMEPEEWQDMLDTAITEQYYMCDVEINGTKIRSAAIRPKGNTSLSSIVADPNSDRYSFKLEFDHYIEGQTCFGLDKLILNNNYMDATNMKEALIYDMFMKNILQQQILWRSLLNSGLNP